VPDHHASRKPSLGHQWDGFSPEEFQVCGPVQPTRIERRFCISASVAQQTLDAPMARLERVRLLGAYETGICVITFDNPAYAC
jgi:hypothetical protein